MAQFIHLTDERLIRRIQKVGIKPSKVHGSEAQYVYATAVLKNFMLSHQWLRELKNRGVRTFAAVQFRIDDDEPVKVGRYNQDHWDTTAAGSVKVFRDHESGLGLQVMIPRKIQPTEIMRIYLPPQIVGWRYYPESHGNPPFCGCDYCQRGLIKSRKIREKYEAKNNRPYVPEAQEADG